MITRDEVLMGRDKQYPLSPELEQNLTRLLEALNKFRQVYGKPMFVSSGYRPPTINAATPGASRASKHMVCLACDFVDLDGSLARFCESNLPVLENSGLWLESPFFTRGWCHLQAVQPKSGKRVFDP